MSPTIKEPAHDLHHRTNTTRAHPLRKRTCWWALFLCVVGFRYWRSPLSTVSPAPDPTCKLWSGDDGLHQSCIDGISRIYPARPDPTEWCTPPSHRPNIFLKRPQMIEEEADPVVGILFIKNTKAASSTGAGVTLRIAEQVGKRILKIPTEPNTNTTTQQLLAHTSCVRNWTHAFANHRGHAHRDAQHSVLWTIVRQPTLRDMSAFFFFQHARQGVEATEDNILEYLQAQKSSQFRYLYQHFLADDNLQPAFQEWLQQNDASEIISKLLQSYDFVALAERMDESLAVLTLLWKLQPADVVVLNAKTSGGYDDGKFHKQCHKIPKPVLTPQIQQYLQSPDYLHDNLDTILYAAANKSLDRTIVALGQEVVQERVQILRQMRQKAQAACQNVAVFPCSAEGVLQRTAAQKSCYIDDSGCGHECVDRVLGVSG